MHTKDLVTHIQLNQCLPFAWNNHQMVWSVLIRYQKFRLGKCVLAGILERIWIVDDFGTESINWKIAVCSLDCWEQESNIPVVLSVLPWSNPGHVVTLHPALAHVSWNYNCPSHIPQPGHYNCTGYYLLINKTGCDQNPTSLAFFPQSLTYKWCPAVNYLIDF